MALQHAQRKMKIAHYGRSKSAKFERVVPLDPSSNLTSKTSEEEKRCSFITANSGYLRVQICIQILTPTFLYFVQCANLNVFFGYIDPIYIAYHDEEWGVPVHDDK